MANNLFGGDSAHGLRHLLAAIRAVAPAAAIVFVNWLRTPGWPGDAADIIEQVVYGRRG